MWWPGFSGRRERAAKTDIVFEVSNLRAGDKAIGLEMWSGCTSWGLDSIF